MGKETGVLLSGFSLSTLFFFEALFEVLVVVYTFHY